MFYSCAEKLLIRRCAKTVTIAKPANNADVLLAAFSLALLRCSFLQERNAGLKTLPFCWDISWKKKMWTINNVYLSPLAVLNSQKYINDKL